MTPQDEAERSAQLVLDLVCQQQDRQERAQLVDQYIEACARVAEAERKVTAA